MEKKTVTAEFTDDLIAHQCNLIHIAEHYGYTPTETDDVRDLALALLKQGSLYQHSIQNALATNNEVRAVFIRHLKKTVRPILCGISRKWRKTQEELLLATIQAFERGYVRLLSEVPTGSGKSMFIGALVRAALDTMWELGLDQEIHILTSRIAIAGQLILEESVSGEQHDDRPLEVGKKGDVRIWCPELPEDRIRLLAGSLGQNPDELKKNALITVSTYQGLTANRIRDHFKKPPLLVICDESHRVTERIGILLDMLKAMTCGVSATVLGPDRDLFSFFERIERPEVIKKKMIYIDYLVYHKSIAEMIKEQELKPIRWINARGIRINISDADLRKKNGIYDVFNDLSVSRILSRNPQLGAEVIAEAYLGEHMGLKLSGSKPIVERRGIAFVDRVETARQCAAQCNELLIPKLKEKYGENVHFFAAHVDGTMSEKEYNEIISKFKRGEITLLFSAEKIGEGVDLPFVDLIILLRALGFGSQWKLVQELGRGLRIDLNNLLADLVVLDMVFESDRHLLASVLGIFGRSSILSGGLLAGWGSSYEIEKKIFDLLKQCKSWTEIWNHMTPEEQVLFPFIKEKMLEEKMRLTPGYQESPHLQVGSSSVFNISSINFIEQDDIRLAMSLGNPDEMLRYTAETLIKEGIRTVEQLQNIRTHSLPMFSRKRFGKFRDGLTMVNLNLQENKTILTQASMTAFIDLMRKAGLADGRIKTEREFQPTLPQPTRTFLSISKRVAHASTPKGKSAAEKTNSKTAEVLKYRKMVGNEESIESLNTAMQNLFGIEPEITSNFRDLYKNPQYVAQAAIALPEGLKFCSTIRKNEDEQTAKQGCAAELVQTIYDQINKEQILLYKDSPWYKNHLLALRLIIHECQYSDVIYTVTERSGIFVVQASVEKWGMKFLGSPAVNKNQDIAKMHAEMFLARELTKQLPSYRDVASLTPGRRHSEKLELLCTSMNILKPARSNGTINIKGVVFHEVRLSAMGIAATGLGINIEHARERAAENLYNHLIDMNGGRISNN